MHDCMTRDEIREHMGLPPVKTLAQRLKDVLVGASVYQDSVGCASVRWTLDEPVYTVGGTEIWVNCPRKYIGTAFRESERRAQVQVQGNYYSSGYRCLTTLEMYTEYLNEHSGKVADLEGRVTMTTSDETLVEDLLALRNFMLALPEYHQREVQQWHRQDFLHGGSILGTIVSSIVTIGLGIWFLTGARVGLAVLISCVVCILLIGTAVRFARMATYSP